MTKYLLHGFVMTLLYFCQGLATSLPGLFPVLIQEAVPGFPISKIAFLSIWSYPFAVKFVWASLVDVFFSGRAEDLLRINRRAQWVLPLQLCMTAGYWLLHTRGEALLLPSNLEWSLGTTPWLGLLSENSLTALFLVVLALLVLGATQDVAVDAWAVEGLPEELSGLGGTLQMVGLVLGSSFTNLFLYLRSSGYGVTLELLFGISAALCAVGGLLALALSLSTKICFTSAQVPRGRARSSDKQKGRGRSTTPRKKSAISSQTEPTAVTFFGSYKSLWGIFRTRAVQDMVLVLLCRGWGSAASSVMQQSLLARSIVAAADIAQLRLVCTVIQVVSGVFIAPIWNKRHPPGWVFRNASRLDLALNACSVVFFSLVVRAPEYRSYYFYLVVAPISVVASVVGTVSFVAVVQQSSHEAKQFPSMTAAIITYLYSVANFGYLMPSSGCLFAADLVAKQLGIEPHVTASLLGAIALGLAISLRFFFLVPASRRMELAFLAQSAETESSGGSSRSGSVPVRGRRSSSSSGEGSARQALLADADEDKPRKSKRD